MKQIQIKIQNVYAGNVNRDYSVYDVDEATILGKSESLTWTVGFNDDNKVRCELFSLWIKGTYTEESDVKKSLFYACSQRYKLNDHEFIGCISDVEDIIYDGEILSPDEINAYFQDYFKDKLIIHDNDLYGIQNIFRFVSLKREKIQALNVLLRDCFNDGKNVFTCFFDDFKFDSIFSPHYGDRCFSYDVCISTDKSVIEFFNSKMNKLFDRLIVKQKIKIYSTMMTDFLIDTLTALKNKLEAELERTKAELTDEERAELDRKQQEYEALGKNFSEYLMELLTQKASQPEVQRQTKTEYKTPETKVTTHDEFKGFADTVSNKNTEKPKNQKNESLASQVKNHLKNKNTEMNDKLYKSLCKDIDVALLEKNYKITGDNVVLVTISNRPEYRNLNSEIINSITDHYMDDEDFTSVNISIVNAREPGGETNLYVTLAI